MPALRLPPDVEAVLGAFYTCEFTTVNKQGQPLTWPTMPYYHQEEGTIIITASVAFPVKTYNARRHPQVSLLFSDPTGCGLSDPPGVLVQGDATVRELPDDPDWSYEVLRTTVERQPDSIKYMKNPVARSLFLFYFQRIAVIVEPKRILSWPHLDFSADPVPIEVSYVE